MAYGDQGGLQSMALHRDIEAWRETLHRARTRLLRTAHASWRSPAARAFALRVEETGDSLTRCLHLLDEVHDDALRLSASRAASAGSGAGGLR